MTPTEPRKVAVKWITRNSLIIESIRRIFNIPPYTTMNGFSPAEIIPEDWELFQECAIRNYISIIDVKWCKNGDLYTFKNRNL